ncbi:type VI secretion system amidase immunity protein Tai4 [Burkholderia ubonensis]|uniref:type VI secretion system amidase immunity protein Tai4 n=1 Tax=Burkholderia ubonensis TaxID=101571 RepID=UPI001E2DACAB|nr:type VI secretion system amidase immunity protein Tai4 [Burkholderia ubonensis]
MFLVAQMSVFHAAVAIAPCSARSAEAADSVMAVHRTNAENFKDRALAACLSVAYQGSPAGQDADITKSAFLEWTYYDEDRGDRAVDQLVKRFLRRDYANSVEGYAGAAFDLLKCLDLYHSPELDEQVRRYVPHPAWIGDKPAGPRRKTAGKVTR